MVLLGAVLAVLLLVLLLLLLLLLLLKGGHLPLLLLLAELLLPHVVVLFLVHLVLALLLSDQDFLLELSIDLVCLLKNVVQFLLCSDEFGDVDVVQILITLIVSILTFLPPVQDQTSPLNDLLPLYIAHVHLHGQLVTQDHLYQFSRFRFFLPQLVGIYSALFQQLDEGLFKLLLV